MSYELLLRYLTLCVSGGHHAEVLDVYDVMCGRFSSLDTGASSLFIRAFSRSGRWREAVSLLRRLAEVRHGPTAAHSLSRGRDLHLRLPTGRHPLFT